MKIFIYRNSYRSGSVEKIKSNSNSENLLITTESSLKKLLARKSNQPSFNNQNAEEVHKQEEVNEILNVSQQGGRQENRPDEIEKNNPNLSNKSPHIAPQDDYPNGEENLTPNQKLAYYQDSHRNQNFSVGIKYDVNNVDSKNKSDSKREINLDHHSDSLEAKRNPPIMTIKREDVVNEEIVEELEEEELSGLVNYEYLNDDVK